MSHTVRVGLIQGFSALVKEYSLEPESLYEQAGINSAVMQDDDARISLSATLTLLGLAAKATNEKYFSLLLAKHQNSTFVGMLGVMIESSPTLGDAIENSIKYMHLHTEGSNWYLSVQEDIAKYNIVLDVDDVPLLQQGIELGLGQAFHYFGVISGNHWKPERVYLHCKKPTDDSFYRNYFSVPIEYNSEFDGFSFHSKALEQVLPSYNAFILKNISHDIEQRVQKTPINTSHKVKRLMIKYIPEDACNIEVIASELKCDKRTLQRRLKDEGHSYQGLLNDVRFTMAKLYLRKSSMPLMYIANTLGYLDASTFSRVFKKWSGLSPLQWRKRNLSI